MGLHITGGTGFCPSTGLSLYNSKFLRIPVFWVVKISVDGELLETGEKMTVLPSEESRRCQWNCNLPSYSPTIDSENFSQAVAKSGVHYLMETAGIVRYPEPRFFEESWGGFG